MNVTSLKLQRDTSLVVLVDLDQLIWSLVLNGAFYLSCNKLTELCNNMHAKCMKVFPL